MTRPGALAAFSWATLRAIVTLRSQLKVLCGVMLLVIGVDTGILLLAGPLPRATYFALAGISAALALAPFGFLLYWFRADRKTERK